MKSFPKFNVFEWHCVIWQGYLGVSLLFDQPCADLRANVLLVLDQIIAETTSAYCHKAMLFIFVVVPEKSKGYHLNSRLFFGGYWDIDILKDLLLFL